MDDVHQQQSFGRSAAATVAVFALLERFEGDAQLRRLLLQHIEIGRTAMLNSQTPEPALQEFEKVAAEMLYRVTKTR